MGKPLVNDDDKSRQGQPPNNRRWRPYILPELNLIILPPQYPTNRPDEDPLISTAHPDSELSSDDEVDDGCEDDGDSDYEDDEEVRERLAQLTMSRELAILMEWMEELRREILTIREELRVLQKKLGWNPKSFGP
ncbi:PREDICTED: uncharacterized protein LOC18592210 isoform X2 [Theobroma cacao]|uniref:Uncharacterized protein LOC18592210 isoform X2 n=1 Tax=Theobroma cacao TaxID=3641 RepID=A0AB32WP34_THECC|nr:PREDICTED: uncharacterized protein LOC18592210 isoform X2 [Theobroma cacao]